MTLGRLQDGAHVYTTGLGGEHLMLPLKIHEIAIMLSDRVV
jgi:hypothetical protein